MARGAVLLAVIVAMLAAAGSARAGTYQVNACAAGGANASWVASNSNDAAFDVKPGCPFEVYSAVTSGARAGFFEAAWWRLTAPPGTVIDRLRLARYGYRFIDAPDRPEGGVNQGGWITGAYIQDASGLKNLAGESCTILPGAYLCDFGSKNTSAPVDFDLEATQVTYQVACLREGGTCQTESDGFPLAGMTIFNAVATIRDDAPPKLAAGGSLLAGGWHRPDEEIVVDASDATGISAAAATAGAATGALATPCNYTRMVPCSNVAGGRIRIAGLGEGGQAVAITVKDAAGNATTTTANINVDGTAPAVAWRSTSGRALVADVTDPLSDVAGGQIAVDGAALPTTLADGRLTAALPAPLAANARVTVSVTDNAGNTASGIPARIVIRDRMRVRNGRAATLRGRLLAPAGGPLANVALQATATIRRRGAAAQPAGQTATDARGRFTLRLPAGPSRTVRLIVPAAGEILPAVRGVSVRVPASSTIHASRHVVSAGGRVTFSGAIRRAGQPLPARGLIVILQGRSAGAWRTFADTRTNRLGRWRASYVFRGVPGRYPVRLRIRRANGFPFELGYSPKTTVRVR
jgi:hypothetical protein